MNTDGYLTAHWTVIACQAFTLVCMVVAVMLLICAQPVCALGPGVLAGLTAAVAHRQLRRHPTRADA